MFRQDLPGRFSNCPPAAEHAAVVPAAAAGCLCPAAAAGLVGGRGSAG